MKPATRIALISLVLGLVWIWGTDIAMSVFRDETFTLPPSIKGSFFVLGMAITIYLLIRNQQRRLIRSERSYRLLYIDNPEPILILKESNNQILDANVAACQFYGYSLSAIRGLQYHSLVAAHHSEIKSSTTLHKLASGKEVYVDLKVSDISFKGQKAQMVVLHDINEREELKNALIQRESMFDSLVKTEHSYLARLDKDGLFEFANAMFINDHKHIHSKFRERPFQDIFLEEDRDKCTSALSKSRSNPGNPIIFTARTFGIKSASPSRTTWEVLTISDALGNPTGFICTGRDHAELDEIRAEVSKTESRLELLLDSIRDGFFIVNFELQVELANKAFGRLVGKSEKELIGKNLSEIIPSWKNTQSSIELPKALLAEKQVLYQAYNPFFDKWLEINAIPFEKGLAVFYHDITHVKENEMNFRRNEANLQSLINNTRDFIWSIDAKYKILTSNSAVQKLSMELFQSSYAPGDDALPDHLDNEARRMFKTFYDRALRGELVEERLATMEIVGRDGYVDINLSPIRDSEDSIIGVACFVRDITVRENHRVALQSEMERYEIISEVTKDAIWDYMVNEDRLTWSDGLKTSFGYDIKETKISWWEERVHPEDFAKAVETFTNAMNSSERNWKSQYRFKKANGKYVSVIDRGVFIRDENGNTIRALGSIQDVEELEQYRQEVQTLSLAMSRTTVGVVLTDKKGRVEWVNSAYVKLTGYTLDELKGRRQGEVLQGPDTDQTMIARMEEALEKREDVTVEILNYGKSGKTFWLRMNVSPVIHNGEVIRFMALITDITDERRINSRLINQNENLKKIAFILSHELRKPVSSILGLLELYNENDSSSTMNNDIIKYMKKATEELDDKVHDIIRQSALIDD
ncbi:MAG: PAS domain S-box protein [Flavobacteriia bacterium]|nr:PAS domain S-box protein [Flavobacteriia bacterium]